MSVGGAAAETVLARRESDRPLLWTVNRAAVDGWVKRQRHILIESPAGWQYLDQPEMADIK